MTGAATTMNATHAGQKEGRDPSPSPGVKPASSGSSDEVEPWDEPPSKNREQRMNNPLGDMMKSVNEFLGVGGTGGEEDGLEDGDLPTLSLKKKQRVSGQYVSGERTTRPLSPPSTNGMEAIKDNDPPMRRSRAPTPRTAKQAAAQRQFWSQLNPPSPFESDVSRDQSEADPTADDGPDDEMAAVSAARAKSSVARELDDASKQGDETVEGDESYRGNVAKVNSYEDGSGTCIEYTLASIGDICGTGQKGSPIKDKNRPTKIREVRGIQEEMVADDAEEHTAIEVEYVDPGPAARRSPPPAAAAASKKEKKKQEKNQSVSPKSGKELPTSRALDGESVELRESEATAWSSSRKNAVLAAMARKAKQEFQKHEEEVSNQGSTPLTPKRAASPTVDEDNTSDIYNNFSPSEKRKFLKLINLGLTPSESTARVVEERKDKEGAKTPGSGKKRFSFWKKSEKVDASPSAAANDIQSVSSTAAVGEAEDVASSTPASPRAVVESEAAVNKAYSPRAKDSSAAAPLTPPGEISDEQAPEKGDEENGVEPTNTASEDSSPEQDENSNPAVAVAAIAATGAAAGVGLVAARQAAVTKRQDNADAAPSTSYETDDDEETSEEEDDSVRGQFPRSGVNYYDGVRRELPEEEDSDDDFPSDVHSPSGKTPTKGRLASLTMTPRSQGFNSLHESGRSISEKKDDDAPKAISMSLSPLGRQSKSSSKDRSTPLSPGSSTSARRRYLGIPMLSTGKGFTPLEEDEDVVITKAVQEELSPKRDEKPPAEVKAAVAAAAVATTAAAATTMVVEKTEISPTPDIAAGTSEDKPLASMDDPFYGLDADNADSLQAKDREGDSDGANNEQAKSEKRDMDISLDTYLDSATIQTYASSQPDQHSLVGGSVLSGRSTYTAGTGMTGHTQSSRKRRPGAAKERIAKAKKAGKNTPAAKGWHESIRAAAESNNRQWDPQRGWVDYKDPSEGVKDVSEERLHISLEGVNMGSPRAKDESQKDERPQSPSVTVPFPPGWEKERNEMLSPAEAASQQGSAPVTPTQTLRPTVAASNHSQSIQQEGSSYPRSVVSDDSPKPRGWEDSMREASAEASKDGRRWDPERGWVGLDKSVVESAPLSPRKDPESEEDATTSDRAETASASEKSESSGKQVASPNEVFAALTKIPSEGRIKDAQDYADSETRSTTSRSTANKETKMDTPIEQSSKPAPSTPANRSEHSTEGSDEAVVAGVGEKYVQLGDNGAVKSVRRESRVKKHTPEPQEKLPFHPSSLRKATGSRAARPDSLYDDDKAPLLTGSTDSTEGRAPDVKVVKQKVDEDDFSLFTAGEGASVGTGSGHGTPSRRRGTGPVDVDEVDDLETETESDDGDEDGHLWEPDSYMKGKVSPGMFVKPRSERSADPAFGAVTKGKTPPKLQKSRRDTSPIRSVGPGKDVASSSPQQEVISPQQVVSPIASPRAANVSSSPDESPARQGAIEQTVSIGDDSAGSSNVVKQLTQKWEVRAKYGTPIVPDQSGDSFEYDERHVTALGDFGGDDQQQSDWPGYSEKQRSPASSQEWKSFLGKKVQAESVAAAAANMEDSRKREGRVASKAGIPRAPGKSRAVGGVLDRATQDENGDSSFSFGEGPSDGDDYSPALSAGSAAARRRERASQQQQQSSSPGGFSDVSPIPPQEEYDVARMERVSDTGTAVEQSSFMKRLSACAAPLSRAFHQPNSCGDTPPDAHLAFMKTNPAGQPSPTGSGRYVPAALCGRQDVINENENSDEEDDGSSKRSLNDTQDTETASPPTSPTSQILREVKERSTSRGRSRRNDPVSDMRSTSSVASDDFGARTSYLEAIALRSAVSSTSSKKKRNRRKSAQDSQSTVSDATSASKLSHSERWQAFLERKASQTASPPGSRAQSSTDISRAAEKYASEKVEEMMEVMASRSKSTPKSWRSEEVNETLDTSYGGDSSTASPLSPYRLAGGGEESRSSARKSKKKSESAKAAEELAAARVEAMMAAMTSSNLDEGEI